MEARGKAQRSDHHRFAGLQRHRDHPGHDGGPGDRRWRSAERRQIPVRGLLVDRNRGAQPLDEVDVRLVHLPQKLARKNGGLRAGRLHQFRRNLKLSCFLLFPAPSNICIAFWCITASACFEYVNSWFTVFTSVTVFIASLQTLFQH